jgi:hypothetical protein
VFKITFSPPKIHKNEAEKHENPMKKSPAQENEGRFVSLGLV